MQIWEFIKELAFFFPLSGTEEHQNRIFDSYVENLEGIAISNKCDYDWKRYYRLYKELILFPNFHRSLQSLNACPNALYKSHIKQVRMREV